MIDNELITQPSNTLKVYIRLIYNVRFAISFIIRLKQSDVIFDRGLSYIFINSYYYTYTCVITRARVKNETKRFRKHFRPLSYFVFS